MSTSVRSAHLAASALAALSFSTTVGHADQVFADDVIIQLSLCVGGNCVNGESFGFDTIRLKEDNLRIHFEDTSNSASFPGNDWRIIANDSTNGGANFLSFEDATAGRTPFKVEAGARANALLVSDSGDIGVGTANPVVSIHVADGDSPTLRLEQDASNGFTTHVWDVAGNETNFFVRDVTNSSRLPFKIRPGALTDALTVSSTGIGMGIATATASLDVRETDGSAQLLVRDTGGSGPRQLMVLQNDGAPQIYMNNTSNNDAQWLFSAGRSLFLSPTDNALDRVFELSNTGNLTIDGTLTQSSDKTRKMAIEPVDPAHILAKVAAMPVAEWTYIHDAEEGIRHIGPMAQDFYAAFGTGADETGISALDGTGVALAAIQALTQENADLRARLDALEAVAD
ncbi:tail fiber domain-containing protein [Jannaschia sp.]|nr:tail fiber domain-containing protein [Jannaschia sp.]MDB2407691.1 tail fiber domain-containing protein [Jannaschia sp.]